VGARGGVGALRPAEWTQAGNRNQRRRVNIRSFPARRLRALKERPCRSKVALGLEPRVLAANHKGGHDGVAGWSALKTSGHTGGLRGRPRDPRSVQARAARRLRQALHATAGKS
jgi:hypothetical protein